jgi:predicted esterase
VPGTARLIDVRIPADPAGVVLVLHGGASRRRSMRVSPAQLSVLRMIPVAHRVARAGRGRLAVVRLLNSRRGWDTAHTPVQDVQGAVEQVIRRFGSETRVCLVGHSLGGRAALLSADLEAVRGVVALAPWVYPTDAVPGVHDTRIVIIHGGMDRIADPGRSAAVARRLSHQTPIAYVCVERGTHAMLRRRDRFDTLAAQCVAWILLGRIDDWVVERIDAGERWLTV